MSSEWGRIDADGTVYVRTADGERAVGSWQAGDAEAGLAYYMRHYDDLATEYQGSYNRTIAHFVNALRDVSPFETAPQDNLETLRLVEDCYRLSGWEALR